MLLPLTAAGESSGSIPLKGILGRRTGIWMILFVMNCFAESGFMPLFAVIFEEQKTELIKGCVWCSVSMHACILLVINIPVISPGTWGILMHY